MAKALPEIKESQDQQLRRRVAADLDEALAYLRVGARTDYYTGYSLTDTIHDRVLRIGEDLPLEKYSDLARRTTHLGRLAVFEDKVKKALAAAGGIE